MNKIPDEEYDKAVGQLRGQILGVFGFMRVGTGIPVRYWHGLGDGVPGAIDELVDLAEQFGMRVRGRDTPIILRKR